MATKKRTSKNLEEKFANLGTVMNTAAATPEKPQPEIKYLPFSVMEPNEHNRKRYTTFDVREKKESIKYKGITTPLLLRSHPDKPDFYRIIDGETRWTAVAELNKEIGFDALLPCIIRTDVITEQDEISLSIIANIQRPKNETDKNNEVADLVKALEYEAQKNPDILEGSTAKEKAAQMLNVSVSTIKREIRAYSLIPELKEEINKGNISQSAAVNLSAVPQEVQRQLIAVIQEKAANNEKMSREETAKIKNEYKEQARELQDELYKLEAEKKAIQRTAKDAAKKFDKLELALLKEKTAREAAQAELEEQMAPMPDPADNEKVKELEKQLQKLRQREQEATAKLKDKDKAIEALQEAPKISMEEMRKTGEIKAILAATESQISQLKENLKKITSPTFVDIVDETETAKLKTEIEKILVLL